MSKKIYIFSGEGDTSKKTEQMLKAKLDNAGFTVISNYDPNADLMVCIGGDGTFLRAIHEYDYPEIPIIGINTGHLGFFQEIMPAEMDDFIFKFSQGKYSIQNLSTVSLKIKSKGECIEHIGLNEVAIKSDSTYAVHLNLSIDGSFIERFNGDGLLVATPAGSTAYNYSLGGSIVDPRLNVLQVTPIAPMNTTAYRSFTSSILLPSDLSLTIIPDMEHTKGKLAIVCDGFDYNYDEAESIEIQFSDKQIHLMRFENYDFWTKVKSKFL